MPLKFVHVSDLHLGKKMSNFSIDEDQRFILKQIAEIAEKEKADGILIAGDVYDSLTPTNEAYNLLSDFLADLAHKKIPVYLISGNHDSSDKLSYGGPLFNVCGIHIAGKFKGTLERVDVKGQDGTKASIFMLPFVRPPIVRGYYPDAKIDNYTDAIRTVIENSDLSGDGKKILIAHQFVTDNGESPIRSDSEQVGGIDNVESSVFKDFDYVALGHIHSSQSIGRDNIRYCGTPLIYSKSECDRGDKTVTVVEVGEYVSFTQIPLAPMRPVRKIRGKLYDLIAAGKEEGGSNDFIYAELTEPAVDAIQFLRDVYPNTLSVSYATEYPDDTIYADEEFTENIDYRSTFADFFSRKTGNELTDEQRKLVNQLFEEAGL